MARSRRRTSVCRWFGYTDVVYFRFDVRACGERIFFPRPIETGFEYKRRERGNRSVDALHDRGYRNKMEERKRGEEEEEKEADAMSLSLY